MNAVAQFLAENKPSGAPKRDQLVVTASMPCCARKSCATSIIAALLPPWLVTIDKLPDAARANAFAERHPVLQRDLVGSVCVPGKSVCSVEMPTGCTGKKVAGTSAGNSSRTRVR